MTPKKNKKKILVICKPSMAGERSRKANLDNSGTIGFVREYLKEKNFSFDVTETINDEVPDDIALVITVGGDGTLLYASHYIGPGVPMLAVNSAPDFSEGYFCGTGKNIQLLKQHIQNWELLPQTMMTRLEVEVEGKILSSRVLNDALFCHSNPAITSRYSLKIPNQDPPEDQLSSGIWFSTAAGSTAAMRSARGFTSPHDSPNLQYLVREPFQPAGRLLQNVHGFIKPGEEIEVCSYMAGGRVFVDGAHITCPVTRGQKVIIRQSSESLTLLNFRQP